MGKTMPNEERALAKLKFDFVPGGDLVPLGCQLGRVVSLLALDMSESMKKFGDVPRSAVNMYFDQLEQDVRLFHITGLVGFGTEAAVLIPPSPIKQVGRLDEYRPNGSTRLFQTVDEGLEGLLVGWRRLSPQGKARTQVVVGVFSDGQDNQSDKALYPQKLQATSAECLREGWILTTFGIGIDGKELARLMGFPEDRAETREGTGGGLHDAMTSLGHTTRTAGR